MKLLIKKCCAFSGWLASFVSGLLWYLSAGAAIKTIQMNGLAAQKMVSISVIQNLWVGELAVGTGALFA